MIWDDLQEVWKVCFEEAWMAYCKGSLPIGAVITNSKNEIVGRGRNRTAICDDDQNVDPSGYPIISNHELAHAEINALLSLRSYYQQEQYVSLRGFTLYTTLEPCPLCMGAFYMSGLRNLSFAGRDTYAGSTLQLGKTPYLARKPITVVGPDRFLEIVSLALTVETMLRQAVGIRAEVINSVWQQEMPQAVQMGERLFETGSLQKIAAANDSISEVFTLIEDELKNLPGSG